jgi:hypothetical protein
MGVGYLIVHTASMIFVKEIPYCCWHPALHTKKPINPLPHLLPHRLQTQPDDEYNITLDESYDALHQSIPRAYIAHATLCFNLS